MSKVNPKKHLGQHFLVDQNIATDIVDQLTLHHGVKDVLEIGPGMGVLTQYLLQNNDYTTTVVEIDRDSIVYLKEHFPQLGDRIIAGDFLKMDLTKQFPDKFAIIGNLPYNISSQIFFAVLKHRDRIPEVVCMIQKEVAERIAAPPGSKTYGILSVLLQAWYTIEYKFTVHEHVFNPPPKVKSGVIRLLRNEVQELACDEKRFFEVVKLSFGTRRKTLRNCLKSYNLPPEVTSQPVFDQRAEQLSVQEFIQLTQLIEQNI